MERQWEQWLKLISHDFRGPLTLILGYLQTVLQHLPSGTGYDQDRRELEAAINASQRLDKMVGEIVDAARLEANLLTITPVAVDVAPIVRDQIKKAHRRYPGRTIRASIADGLPHVAGDGRRIGQIVATLLSNAIVFSPATSEVAVSVGRVADTVEVTVADQGVGLTRSEKERVFEKFFRHERAQAVRREGLGLSLRVAESLARIQNGRLWVESPGPERGSTFHLNLPIADESIECAD